MFAHEEDYVYAIPASAVCWSCFCAMLDQISCITNVNVALAITKFWSADMRKIIAVRTFHADIIRADALFKEPELSHSHIFERDITKRIRPI